MSQHNRVKRKNRLKVSGPVAKTVNVIVFILFLLCTIGMLYPYFYGLNISFMENGRAFMRDTTHIPMPPHFENYAKAFEELNLSDNSYLMMIVNSLWYSAGSTICGLLSSSCAAYVICKYRFRGRNFLYNMAIVIMMIPIYGNLPAQYKLFTKLNLVNSPLYLVTTLGGFGGTFIYAYAFFKSLSWSYAEAAFIDGASHFKVFIKVMMPMLLPSLTALGIIAFIGSWNDYMGPLLWLDKMPTLASGLWSYERKIQYTANQPVYFAGVILSLLPILAIFVIFQNTIMSNIYAGGLKG